MDNKKYQKSSYFLCEKCSFETTRKSQFDRHKFTLKHTNTDKLLTNTDANSSDSSALLNNFIWF